jgi:hypothetical protein
MPTTPTAGALTDTTGGTAVRRRRARSHHRRSPGRSTTVSGHASGHGAHLLGIPQSAMALANEMPPWFLSTLGTGVDVDILDSKNVQQFLKIAYRNYKFASV